MRGRKCLAILMVSLLLTVLSVSSVLALDSSRARIRYNTGDQKYFQYNNSDLSDSYFAYMSKDASFGPNSDDAKLFVHYRRSGTTTKAIFDQATKKFRDNQAISDAYFEARDAKTTFNLTAYLSNPESKEFDFETARIYAVERVGTDSELTFVDRAAVLGIRDQASPFATVERTGTTVEATVLADKKDELLSVSTTLNLILACGIPDSIIINNNTFTITSENTVAAQLDNIKAALVTYTGASSFSAIKMSDLQGKTIQLVKDGITYTLQVKSAS